MKKLWVLMLVFAMAALPVTAREETDDDADTGGDKKPMSAATFKGLEWRSIGPAYNSGRVVDFAVVPDAHNIIYAATASGGLWKTVNSGTTWEPDLRQGEVVLHRLRHPRSQQPQRGVGGNR